MSEHISNRRETWKTILLFLVLVIALTSPFHYAIVKLYPSRIYVGAIMWCPAIAAFLTLKMRGRKISSLNWNWGKWKYIKLSYLIPAIYGIITYLFIWVFGLGNLANGEAITEWGKELGLFGIGTLNPTEITIIGILLLGTVEVIRASATTLGEETEPLEVMPLSVISHPEDYMDMVKTTMGYQVENLLRLLTQH